MSLSRALMYDQHFSVALSLCALLAFGAFSTLVLLPFVVVFAISEYFNMTFARMLLWDYLSISFPHLVNISRMVAPKTYGKCIYFFDPASKPSCMALTIDDCPGTSAAEMALILDVLRKHGAHATVFCTTDYIENGGFQMMEIIKKIVSDGHELGNHMPEDKPYDKLPAHVFEAELTRSEEILSSIDGSPVNRRWFRPPMGRLSSNMSEVLCTKGYRGIVMGNVFSNDPFIGGAIDPPRRDSIRYHIEYNKKYAKDGSIVIFHVPNASSRRQLLPILSELLPHWEAKGKSCVTLSQLSSEAQK